MHALYLERVYGLCDHKEDEYNASISYVLDGALKVWSLIAVKYRSIFEAFVAADVYFGGFRMISKVGGSRSPP